MGASALTVNVRFAPEADEYPEAPSCAKVFLVDSETGIGLSRRSEGANADGDPAVILAPAGRVRVVAEGRYTQQYPTGDMGNRRRHGRGSAVLDVAAGVNREVTVDLPLGGAIRVAASSVSLPSNQSRSPSFKIELLGAGAFDALELEHLVETKSGGSRSTSWWNVRGPVTSERVPAGRYRMTATMGSSPPIEKDIIVESGTVTNLELTFE